MVTIGGAGMTKELNKIHKKSCVNCHFLQKNCTVIEERLQPDTDWGKRIGKRFHLVLQSIIHLVSWENGIHFWKVNVIQQKN